MDESVFVELSHVSDDSIPIYEGIVPWQLYLTSINMQNILIRLTTCNAIHQAPEEE